VPIRPAAAVSSPSTPPIPTVSAPAPVAPIPPRSPSTPPIPTVSAPPTLPPTPKAPGAAPTTPPIPGAGAATAPVVTVQGDVKIIHLKPPIVVRDFATALGLKPFKLISEMMEMGIFASMNQNIEESVATKLAEKHGFLLEIKHRADAAAQQAAKEKEKEKKKPEEDEAKNLAPRPPVVVILGHVDHGKTSLLDAIRKADVAAGEAGGITQHIGAYQIDFNDRKITFLDTPGHAAFNKMRARGASITDIAVLVVAADDGFMPQTDEALKHAQNAKVALIVAVNKMDVKGANIDQVKAQMQQRGIAPEDWGGDTITVPVSAIKGTGIDELLEMILLQADVLELKANPKAEASGVIVESQIEVGRGPLATVIVQRGTLKVGDSIVCGPNWAKVRAMFDDQGRNLKEAPPSTPVRVIGWSGTPDSGATFRAVKNAREAENLADEEALRIKKELTTTAAAPKEVSVESLFANIAATQAKVLKVIIKTDVFGSTEAVRNVLENIKSTKVSLEIVSTEVGLVTKNDVLMASAAGATIIGFNTKLENGVTPLAKHHGVRIETFDIIYELADKVRDMLADLLDPELRETKIGGAEVRATFPLAKGFVAGCLVTEGKITRNASARVRRGRETVYEGKVGTLKRFKDDANEVRAGLECGIKLDDFNDYKVGDLIEVFEIQKVRASL
jgi:translation initiation factor IF-2